MVEFLKYLSTPEGLVLLLLGFIPGYLIFLFIRYREAQNYRWNKFTTLDLIFFSIVLSWILNYILFSLTFNQLAIWIHELLFPNVIDLAGSLNNNIPIISSFFLFVTIYFVKKIRLMILNFVNPNPSRYGKLRWWS